MRPKPRLAPRSRVKAHLKKQERLAEREVQAAWKAHARRSPCAMCQRFPVRDPEILKAYHHELRDLQGHHAIPQSRLKSLDLHYALWDIRNCMTLCGYHHPRHTNWRERVPRELVPLDVYDFCAELKIEWVLDHEYPLAA